MFIVEGVVVSSEIFSEKFHCNLKKCKGACCWEGDFGAPLEQEEEHILTSILPTIKDSLPKASQAVIEEEGAYIETAFHDNKVTPLLENGACVYLVKTENGGARCGIEKAHAEGQIDFKKPISCHLYPIRVTNNESTGYEALNYDEWDICSSACSLGAEKDMPVYRFVKDALLRKYGQEFYDQLEGIYEKYFRKGEKKNPF